MFPTSLHAATTTTLLFVSRDPAQCQRVMATIDMVNSRYGRGTLWPLATGIAKSWWMRSAHPFRRYTMDADKMIEATTW